MGGMWSRCWWATWLSGFFGIAGLVHVARFLFFAHVPIVIGQTTIPPTASGLVGLLFLVISGGLLGLELYRARAQRIP